VAAAPIPAPVPVPVPVPIFVSVSVADDDDGDASVYDDGNYSCLVTRMGRVSLCDVQALEQRGLFSMHLVEVEDAEQLCAVAGIQAVFSVSSAGTLCRDCAVAAPVCVCLCALTPVTGSHALLCVESRTRCQLLAAS
jgi:hypothetical protein